MKKILIIIGTRPEAIKMAPVITELKKYHEYFETKLCITAQHREMLDQVLMIFDIIPDIDLNLMETNQSLPNLTSRVLIKLTQVLKTEKPDLLLVQGDTTTVMTASLAAFYQRVPVGHIEAGLRTKDCYSPFPEEMNRRLTSVLATYHFAPTERAKQALLTEGVQEDLIFVTGNTVIDALHLILKKPRPDRVENILRSADLSSNNTKLILVTAHRRENFGQPFKEICKGLVALAERNQDISILYPVHLNPNVREAVFSILQNVKGIHLIDAVEYDVMAHLMKESYFIITDSGGIQEEAPWLGKPVLVLRTKTERPEAVEAGVAKIIGPRADAIIREGEKLLRNRDEYRHMAKRISLYGDGKAAERIIKVLLEEYS
ncbi:MAG: UDP-N-acetylglucosamine 2-epimerase (non-hydrolyzing) [Candidatus Aminicenantes bacterium]|nr:MAG: UDP-N-acetylglucosamine 2-epimerase (non-hydrolyzing) [Candidatus Aminicenantes bacterium]